jgi:hypothetical protein
MGAAGDVSATRRLVRGGSSVRDADPSRARRISSHLETQSCASSCSCSESPTHADGPSSCAWLPVDGDPSSEAVNTSWEDDPRAPPTPEQPSTYAPSRWATRTTTAKTAAGAAAHGNEECRNADDVRPRCVRREVLQRHANPRGDTTTPRRGTSRAGRNNIEPPSSVRLSPWPASSLPHADTDQRPARRDVTPAARTQRQHRDRDIASD